MALAIVIGRMPEWPALLLAVLAAVALTAGMVIEYRQRSHSGPIPVVPTLPYAVQAAILAGLAFTYLRIARHPLVAWWHVPLAFVIVLASGVWLIVAVGGRADRNRRQ